MSIARLRPTFGRIFGPQDGFALVIVLWMMTLFAVLAAAFSTSTRTEAQTALNIAEQVEARLLAEAAVQRGIFELLNRQQDLRWKADGTEYPVAVGGVDLRVSLIDERGKIDLNFASEDLLRGALIAGGAPDDTADTLVDAIADWRDEDDLARLRGAEAADYQQAGRRTVPANALFRTKAELQQVFGLNADLYGKLEPLVTVYSFAPTIDPNAASRKVLMALPGVDAQEVEEFLSAREEKRYEDDGVPLPLLPSAGPWLGAGGGSVFTVKGSVELSSGAVVAREAVVWIVQPGSADHWILDSSDSVVWQTAEEASE